MKLRNIIYSLSLLVGVLTLGSCVNDDDVCLPEGKTQVIFTLVLQDNVKAATRVGDETWNNYTPKEDGVEYDNYIDLNNLQVLVFGSDDTYKGTLADMVYTAKGAKDPDKYEATAYEYIGTAPSDISAGTYKFVILANCAKVNATSTTTLASLNDLAYNLFADSGNTQYIPMWGVKEAPLTLVAGARQELGTIGLLRAMSKVNVKLTGNALSDHYTIKDVTVSRYNKSGYTLPTGAATVASTEVLNLDASIHVNASAATNKKFTAAEGATELTFYLTDYDNWGTGATPAGLIVTLTKTNDATYENTFTDYPLQFQDYVKTGENAGTVDKNGQKYNIIRNHLYRFNITHVSDDGKLYVDPTVLPWEDADPLTYTINMSTSMRLFDSWLYRYDTDNTYGWGGTDADAAYNHWNESYMVVSNGRDTETERPLRSPQIQLVTTCSSPNTFELYVDNSDFEIIQAVKNTTGVVTDYTASTNGTLSIAAGPDVYTYFYIVPKEGVTFTSENSKAHVFLYYNDSVLGKQEMTFNYGAFPGYSDDSSEIWVYYVSETAYDAGKIDDDNAFMKMYYQDSINPLVPVP